MSARSWPTPSLAASLVLVAAAAHAWTPIPVADDPLVRMPGTQPADGVTLDPPGQCTNCHDGYDSDVDPGFYWRGTMMAQAGRDPLFWAGLTVAAQDSIWVIGRPNAADLCLRCHSPSGWLGGRSDPSNGSNLVDADFDGVFCEACHKMYDPFFEDTFAGVREGNDWVGYWDETNLSDTPSSTAAATTLGADRTEAESVAMFNGNDFYDMSYQPPATWTEHAGGQYFMAASNERRASFADANANHSMFYSRHHKSRYFCAACHDVSNSVLANLAYDGTSPGDGVTELPTELEPAHSYGHIERTFSEFMLSDYGLQGGSPGIGPYDPADFTTSHPGNAIATCQDCHMPDTVGKGCNKNFGVVRPTNSDEHPNSGQPVHDLTGGNMWVPWLLASTVPSSPNYDSNNADWLGKGSAVLTMDLQAGEGLDADALLDAVGRAHTQLQQAATIDNLGYDDTSGAVTFRVQNNTGHKLISGYPEGRRMFVNVRVYQGGSVIHEVNPYDSGVSTLKGLSLSYSPSSPPLGAGEAHEDTLVYEVKSSSSYTGELITFHMALATHRYKDNRIPPKGFRIGEAAARLIEPVIGGVIDPGYFTAAEYAGGYDEVQLVVPAGADAVEVRLFYQTTSRELIEFFESEIEGTADTLFSPTPSSEAEAYVVQGDPFFSQLKAWGTTIWQVWDYNRDIAGAAPVLMADAIVGEIGGPCAVPGSDGDPCDDGDACTENDSCLSGICDSGTSVVCSASDQCHGVGTCDPGTGVCSDPPLGDGTACDDGSLCTVTDTCQSGVCQAGTPVVCTASDQCHGVGTCDPGTGVCSDPQLGDGTGCDDGDLCTVTDTCQSGVCQAGAAVVCTASDECHDVGVCSSSTGVCSDPAKMDGTSCTGGTCAGGVCSGAGGGGQGGTGGGGQGGTGGGTGGSTGGTGGSTGGTGGSTGGTGGAVIGGQGGVAGEGGTPGGGAGGTPGEGGGPAGGSSAGGAETSPADDGGCGCRSAASPKAGYGGWWLLALVLAARRRRSRSE